jgi:CBS-domain-containing membrane protein
MTIIDQTFRHNIGRYLFQCGLASLTILLVLAFVDVLTRATLVAALGASTLVVFTMPSSCCTRPRRVIGGYAVGLAVGWLYHLAATLPFLSEGLGTGQTWTAVFGALAVGTTILVMAATDTVHAPAAGAALALVLNQWNLLTIGFILLAVGWLALARRIWRPVLIDLVHDAEVQCPDAGSCGLATWSQQTDEASDAELLAWRSDAAKYE